MKVITPEIAWHESASPIFSCDLQPSVEVAEAECNVTLPWTRLATCGGGENVVRIWRLLLSIPPVNLRSKSVGKENITLKPRMNLATGAPYPREMLEPLAALSMHKKPVNVVRWSRTGYLLASGSDDCTVCLWRRADEKVSHTVFTPCEDSCSQSADTNDKESWIAVKVLKSHLEDVMDLCWSPADDAHLVSGAVDNSAIVWRLPQSLCRPKSADSTSTETSKASVHCLVLHDHQHYVQGVAWDPRDVFVCSMSSDRSLRVYRVGSRNCLHHVVRAKLPPNPTSGTTKAVLGGKLFQDDSWKAFFRRLQFSPDGEFLLCPAGVVSDPQTGFGTMTTASSTSATVGSQQHQQHAAHLFHRNQLAKPLLSYPTQRRAVIAVRFCPQPFYRRANENCLFAVESDTPVPLLPYRWVFCLALEDASLVLGDTDHLMPLAQLSGLHYESLNDISWSSDGRVLVTCSRDGYCTMVYFEDGELGEPYPREKMVAGVVKPNIEAQSLYGHTPKDSGKKKRGRPPTSLSRKKQQVENVEVATEDKAAPVVELVSGGPSVVDSPSNTTPSNSKKRRVTLTSLVQDTEATVTTSPCQTVPSKTPITDVVQSELTAAIESPSQTNKRRRVSFVTLGASALDEEGAAPLDKTLEEVQEEGVPESMDTDEKRTEGTPISHKRRVSFGESLSKIHFYDPKSSVAPE